MDNQTYASIPDQNPTRFQRSKINAVSDNLLWKLNPMYRALGRFARIDRMNNETENDLARDAFWAYYLNNVEHNDPLPAGTDLHKRLMDWIMGQPAWQQSKDTLTGNMLASGYAAQMLTEQLINDPAIQEAMDAQEEASRLEEEAKNEEAMTGEQPQQGDQPQQADGQPEQGDPTEQTDAQALHAAAAAQQAKANELLDKVLGSGIAQAMAANAITEANDKAEQVSAIARGWGNEDGTSEATNIDEIQKINDTLKDSTMSELASLIGRVKGIAASHTKGKGSMEITITTAGYTKNIMQLFTSELATLSPKMPPTMQAQAFADLCDTGLLGTISTTEAKRQGGMVVLVDGSSSMQGERNLQAKALAIGLARAAKENSQRYWISQFASRGAITEPITEKDGSSKLLNWAGYLMGGGTDFDRALSDGCNIIDDAEEPEALDILMITDGEADINHETAARLQGMDERFGTRLFVVQLSTSSEAKLMKKAAHTWLDFTNLDAAADILAAALWK